MNQYIMYINSPLPPLSSFLSWQPPFGMYQCIYNIYTAQHLT